MKPERAPGCVFCESAGGEVLWADERCRVVWSYQPEHPGFCRVIWDAHAKEMTALEPAQRVHLMRVVFATEQALIATVAPDKINLASLGNQVPHLHWHVIPRFRDDPHFPNPVWGEKQRDTVHPFPGEFAARMRAAFDDLLHRGELKT